MPQFWNVFCIIQMHYLNTTSINESSCPYPCAQMHMCDEQRTFAAPDQIYLPAASHTAPQFEGETQLHSGLEASHPSMQRRTLR